MDDFRFVVNDVSDVGFEFVDGFEMRMRECGVVGCGSCGYGLLREKGKRKERGMIKRMGCL